MQQVVQQKLFRQQVVLKLQRKQLLKLFHSVSTIHMVNNQQWLLKKMPDWFTSIMQIMIPNVEVAHLMQKVMSFVELAIGLAIMAGFSYGRTQWQSV